MKPQSLPAGAWEVLLPRALALIDDIQKHGGLTDPFWTLGGGTVLMFRYQHRLSKDIDIFVPDPQYLGFVTPRLSDTAADLTSDYTELPGSFVKLQFDEGEVDFVAAPNLLDEAWELWEFAGRNIRVETAAEIIAKKLYHRGDRATARDLFDLTLVIEREPQQLRRATAFLLRHRKAFLAQLELPRPGLVAEATDVANRGQ
jgi:predicted nucleotidyltransferase component of viral defense system